jgi:antitoxin component of MazEF toxin-antitoxin module
MHTKLVQLGDNLALMIDPDIARRLKLDEGVQVEIQVRDGALVITPVEDKVRTEAFESALREINRDFGDLLKRLAD